MKGLDMLVLGRKVNQTIQIGPDITLTVVRLTDGAVTLGVEAPRDVVVLRGELLNPADAKGKESE